MCVLNNYRTKALSFKLVSFYVFEMKFEVAWHIIWNIFGSEKPPRDVIEFGIFIFDRLNLASI